MAECTNGGETNQADAEVFRQHGIPLRIRSDGGPQYDSAEYREFLKAWGVSPGYSSPRYAQSNGLAESAVKAMKNLVAKTGDIFGEEFQLGLLEWRNTPKSHGKSPAEMVFGRQQRSIVPSLAKNLTPTEAWKEALEKRIALLQEKSRYYYNAGAKFLPELDIGTEVRLQNPDTKRWLEQGEIVRKGPHRDYYVKLLDGNLRWRNRRFLRPMMVPSEINSEGGGDAVVSGDDRERSEKRPRRSERHRKRPDRLTVK